MIKAGAATTTPRGATEMAMMKGHKGGRMEPKMVAGIGGIVLLVSLYLAGLAGCVYIGYLIILALKKYAGA
jgi:hypothetical protein